MRELATEKRYLSSGWQGEICKKNPLFTFAKDVCGPADLGRGSAAQMYCQPSSAFESIWIRQIAAGMPLHDVPGVSNLWYFRSASPAANDFNKLVFVWGTRTNPKFISCANIEMSPKGISRGYYCQAYYLLRGGVEVQQYFWGHQDIQAIRTAVDKCFINIFEGSYSIIKYYKNLSQ
jgi:hypothetical protein